jgi:carbohydrate kinase (thermoresistant glucokinase family)
MTHRLIIIMGVSGSGKTTVGKLLSGKTGLPFYDADSFHSKENIDKMQAGIPLTDKDRWPWLDSMNVFAKEKLQQSHLLFTCSALKEIYRQRLTKDIESNCHWVYLRGDFDTILKRMQQREQHYMPAALLQSQFDLLQEPANALVEDIVQSPQIIVEHIISALFIQ